MIARSSKHWLQGPTRLRTVIMSVEQYGPDKMGRMWDHNYTEVEFLACLMECGTQRDYVIDHPFSDYWADVDTWFLHHYPERFDKQQLIGAGRDGTFSGQMGFKIALWRYLGEHDGATKNPDVQKYKRQRG